MSVTALTFPAFVDTTSSEQLWQIFNAIQGQVGGQTPVVSGGITGTTSVTPGSITAYVVNVAGLSTLSFSTTTTATGGTIGIYGSIDGINYISTSYVALASGNSATSFSAATPTIGQINTVGLNYIAFKATSVTGGSVIITTVGSNAVSNVMLDNPLPTGTNVIGVVGTQAANGTVTFSGGTATSTTGVALGVSPTKSLTIQNTSTGSAVLFVSTTSGTLTNVNSINIGPGVGYQFPYIPTGTIYIGASASCTYSFWYA